MKHFFLIKNWIERNIIELGREMRISFLPPLMIYLAAGVSGLTGIVGTFFVKDYLDLSASFLASLGFWAAIPWTLKMPIGHLVDLFWSKKALLVFLGAGLIASSLLIMYGLLTSKEAMAAFMSVRSWYVLSALLAPTGYVIQDVVADAMTVEAVPRFDTDGAVIESEKERLMHTTMQTLGRVAIIGGGIFVALANIYIFKGIQSGPAAAKVALYAKVYLFALVVPCISVAGVLLASVLKQQKVWKYRNNGFQAQEIELMLGSQTQRPDPNWWILGGSCVFVIFTLAMGLGNFPLNQEIIFSGSLAIVLFLMYKLTRAMEPEARKVLTGTAFMVFMYRAVPGPGAGSTWFMIDELGFDEQFLALLSLIGSSLTLAGMFIFRRFMAEKSMSFILLFLTFVATILSLPNIALYYGLGNWAAAHTGGVIDARFIALVDTALESPWGQIAMIPMLAWIANSAPRELKATFFAVLAAFTNLSLSLGQLLTKYLNKIFIITRSVKDGAGSVTVPANYDELGVLLIIVTAIGLFLPLSAILIVRWTPLQAVGMSKSSHDSSLQQR